MILTPQIFNVLDSHLLTGSNDSQVNATAKIIEGVGSASDDGRATCVILKYTSNVSSTTSKC